VDPFANFMLPIAGGSSDCLITSAVTATLRTTLQITAYAYLLHQTPKFLCRTALNSSLSRLRSITMKVIPVGLSLVCY